MLGEDARLSSSARGWLVDPGNEVLLSAAVVWEVSIKQAAGKLEAPSGFAETLVARGAVPLPGGAGPDRAGGHRLR